MNNIHLDNNTIVIDNYDKISTFSSFLPGLAGVKGIPIWSFYTNRGQGINSFGIQNKSNSIMEFNPANTAYENISLKGFRTFIKVDGKYFEPFLPTSEQVRRTMYIHKNTFSVEETNHKHGLRIRVKYYILPNESIGALVRKVEVSNITYERKTIEILDGMPKIIPFGIQNGAYKEMSNLLKSWTEIKNIDKNIPYYTMRASSDDAEEVSEVEGGYFYLTVHNNRLTPIIYDSDVIFGYDNSLINPIAFKNNNLSYVCESLQCYANKVPCGFTPLELSFEPEETHTFTSLIGFANAVSQINNKIEEICSKDYLYEKERIAERIADDFTADVKTNTSHPLFDQYIEQCYLDNFLRGGYPYVFGEGNQKSVIHLFSRKHGDPERDYNFFAIAGEYYSQGNGNFRDVNQNRRNDVFFNKEVEDFNIKTFSSLIQIDGYNPLEVRPCTFSLREDSKEEIVNYIVDKVEGDPSRILKVLEKSFTPGQLSNSIARYEITLQCEEDQFLEKILGKCNENIEAGFGEGYWSDHWTYNMDLIDDYKKIYPDKEKDLLYGKKEYRFYDSPARVMPRSQKYVIHKDKVRQYGALVHDEEKVLQAGFNNNGTNWLKTINGTIYETNLIVKLISLALNKFTLLDPYGMGVEMEGGKPGWNDAMNGLPGLFGSSMAETFELKRLLKYIYKNLVAEDGTNIPKEIDLPIEIYDLLLKVSEALRRELLGETDSFTYWNEVASLREEYRDKVRFHICGEESKIKTNKLKTIIRDFEIKVRKGIKIAVSLGKGIVPTYFTYEATSFIPRVDEQREPVLNHNELPTAEVLKFEVKLLPRFLEGPARMLNTIDDKKAAEQLCQNIKNSDIYDPKIMMYKTSESLEEISMEHGRIRAFTPGWLERESVFLHMEYKYLLGMLRAGLYDMFFSEIQNTLIPFLDPNVYGRSILENSSFIASSVNPDSSVHGRGYVARLSGSTTEMISMWMEMFIGRKIFTYEDHVLRLHFEPKLPGWLFDQNGEISFQLFSGCQVTYRNREKKDTFGQSAGVIKLIKILDDNYEVEGNELMGQYAEKVRNGEINKILIEID